MQPDEQIIQPGISFKLVCVVVYVVGSILFWTILPFGIADRFRIWIAPYYMIAGALWLIDVFMTRIVLGNGHLRIVSISAFCFQTFQREEIDRVTWEKGCGASIILRSGKGVRLPGIRNPQSLTNTIRAWLKRTNV